VCVEKYILAKYSSSGVPWNPVVPQNIYVSFKGSLYCLGKMVSCLSIYCASHRRTRRGVGGGRTPGLEKFQGKR